nr:MAG TPA: hypothetical protein [Caudoviricetes sp.]DAR06299.1 MAG TPA: hypothetical protein [Caudoviricetes sp.]
MVADQNKKTLYRVFLFSFACLNIYVSLIGRRKYA